MKRVILALILVLASGSALAGGRHHHHGHGRISLGFHFGVPLGWYQPWYYAPPPAYYYPSAPVVVQPPAPTTYVERSDVVPEGTASWYFCRESNGYYPYVKQCPGGWQRVPAQPPQ
jgi:hypothetical protein